MRGYGTRVLRQDGKVVNVKAVSVEYYPTEHERFMLAILERPDDDAPRLMYSDWLTERGDPRGEFIRVQCELAKMLTPVIRRVTGEDDGPVPDPLVIRHAGLKARERELRKQLLHDHIVNLDLSEGWTWESGEFGVSITAGYWHPDYPIYKLFPPGGGGEVANVYFRHGFVDEIRLTTEDFLAHAKALFATQPITKVRLTDREPTPQLPVNNGWLGMRLGQFRWFVTTSNESQLVRSHWLPRWLDPHSLGTNLLFDTDQEAHAWLSNRCVAYGREEAKLPKWVRRDART